MSDSRQAGGRDEWPRCSATIWPAHADRWVACPGHVKADGTCTAYGSQHRADLAAAASGETGAGGEADEPPACPTCGKRQWPVIHSCPWPNGRPAPSAGQDAERLRDEVAKQAAAERLREELREEVMDALVAAVGHLIPGRTWNVESATGALLARLTIPDRVIAERDEARATRETLRTELAAHLGSENRFRDKVLRVEAFVSELAEDSRTAKRLADEARVRGDREMQRINMRHARVAHHAAAELRRALGPS